MLKKRLIIFTIISLFFVSIVDTDVFALTGSDIDSITGVDRYETAGLIFDKLCSKQKNPYHKFDRIYIANADNSLADALVASSYGEDNGAVLLTSKDEIPEATYKRLLRTNTKNIVILGGKEAVSDKVENRLKSLNFQVDRIGGWDRLETGLLKAFDRNDYSKPDYVFFSNGYTGEADAMSISPILIKTKSTLLLTNSDWSTRTRPENYEEAYELYYFDHVCFLGTGSENLKYNYYGQIVNNESDTVSKWNGFNKREILGGTDRFETNKMIIKKFYNNPKEFYVIDGYKLVDAVSASYLAALEDKPIVLVSDGSDKSILKGAKKITAIGGISDKVLKQCAEAANK